MPELAKQLQGPPQASGQGPVMPELAKQLQGPPQASGTGPVMPELAKQLQDLPRPQARDRSQSSCRWLALIVWPQRRRWHSQ